MIENSFQERIQDETPRLDDERDEYQKDKARVIHSFAFRRLQAKTQVMGVGEGDFHRTRLTHSIEVAQIAEGLLNSLRSHPSKDFEIGPYLPSRDLLSAACLAHAIGHPPFGHGGEKALHQRMADCGGFEGNGQTLRIITRLERYRHNQGMNPTRRFMLAILKYPSPYSFFPIDEHRNKPPKCYFDSEQSIVHWALSDPFFEEDVALFTTTKSANGKPKYRTLDCSIMEAADDIAYGVHDLEDIVARGMVLKDEILERLRDSVFESHQSAIGPKGKSVRLRDFEKHLFNNHTERKEVIGKLVHLFITSSTIKKRNIFRHSLLDLHVHFDPDIKRLLNALKALTYELVVEQAEIQQLELRGQRIIRRLFDNFILFPQKLIPRNTWESFSEDDSTKRKVCDYIAGMTDSYADKIYSRLFLPGKGSSRDEI